MKKLFGISVLALALVAFAQQEASAWTNIRFGIGANMAWQTGNNSAIWGLWRDGQVPGAPSDATGFRGGQGGQGGHFAGGGFGGGQGFGGPGFGYGNVPPGFSGPGPDGAGPGPISPTPEPPPQPPTGKTQTGNNGNSGPEQVGYYYNNGVRRAAYSTPTYYQPNYSYYYYVPQGYYGR